MKNTFIDEKRLNGLLKKKRMPTAPEIRAIFKKGRNLRGLTVEETACLLSVRDADLMQELFSTAANVKQSIYGDRLVFFAPLYLSNYCINDCDYCGFHIRNKSPRKRLTKEEIIEQVTCLINMGHKRLLLEFGEDPENNPIDYIVDAIRTVYSVKNDGGEIRRVNINIAATTVENYRKIKTCGIGTYQLFQETYHKETFNRLHRGPKSDYFRQLYAMDRAYDAGIDDVGIGVLFGLYDWRFEVLGLLSHAIYLKEKFGVGPNTISIPRFRPATSVEMQPPCPVSDGDFLKLIAILRIAVPYTGMIITTRESAAIREKAFKLGITQTSAASSTSPGGFGQNTSKDVEQFELSDKRSLDDIALNVMKQGYTPSFCTACYRKERTGATFMDLAEPGDIQEFCQPNSILTLMEYLEDHASPETKKIGIDAVEKELAEIKNPAIKRQTEESLEKIKKGKRDIYF
jgi:2-iminoacetate synthase